MEYLKRVEEKDIPKDQKVDFSSRRYLEDVIGAGKYVSDIRDTNYEFVFNGKRQSVLCFCYIEKVQTEGNKISIEFVGGDKYSAELATSNENISKIFYEFLDVYLETRPLFRKLHKMHKRG